MGVFGFAGRPTAASAQAGIAVYAEEYEQAWTGASQAEALERNPDLSVVLVGSLYPEDLRHDTLARRNVSPGNRRRLDTRRADSYGALADWYTEMIRYYAGRKVPVDIITLVNEPAEQLRRFGVSARLTVLLEGGRAGRVPWMGAGTGRGSVRGCGGVATRRAVVW